MRYEVSKVLKQDLVMDLVFGNSSCPGKILGRHFVNEGQVISAYHPDAVAMWICTQDGEEHPLDAVERQPVFSAYYPSRKEFPYKIKMKFRDGNCFEEQDPYNYRNVITKQEEEWFSAGIWTESYKKMGAHVMTIDGVTGTYFAVWAPAARRVSIVGDFNFWNGMLCPMNRLEDSGIFELFLPGLVSGFKYKYEIKTWDGSVVQKADPCGRMNLRKTGDASVMIADEKYQWHDQEWMKNREKRFGKSSYISVVDYSKIRIHRYMLKDVMSEYTHVLVGGKPEDGDLDTSWTDAGVYSLPFEDVQPNVLREAVDKLHQTGIGVIIKCNFGYFHDDASGISMFDGSSLYGFSDERKHYNDEKHKFRFSYSKDEVKGYLYAAIKMWINEYHVDGILFENQSEIVFPDWDVDEAGQNYRKCSTAFFEQVYRMIKAQDAGILVMGDATDSRNMHVDMLYGRVLFDYYEDDRMDRAVQKYFSLDREKRMSAFYQLTAPFMRSGVGDCVTNLNGLAGLDWNQDQQTMFSACLLGMQGMKKFVVSNMQSEAVTNYQHHLVSLSNRYKALQYSEYGLDSFEWIDGMNAKSEVISFIRKSPDGDNLLFVCNFSDAEKTNYTVGVPEYIPYTLVSDSSLAEITEENSLYYPDRKAAALRKQSISVNMKPYHTMIFAYNKSQGE